MMALLFFLLFLATMFAWFGYRYAAVTSYVVSLVLSAVYFMQLMTSQLAIQL